MTTLRPRLHSLFVLLKVGLLVPLCVMAVLAASSLILEWNLLTLLLFWFVLAPFFLFVFSRVFRVEKTWQTAVALVCFYGWMIFMIYEHHASDYFALMIASLLYNLVIMMIVMLSDWNLGRPPSNR